MNVHDGLDHTDGTQAMYEPPGYDDGGSAGDPHGYDGYDEGSGAEPAGGTDGGPDDGGTAPDDGGTDTGSNTGSNTGSDTGSGSTGGTMIVEVDGQTRELPAEKDYTGDGQADAVVETADGHVIVFADTENNETGAAGPDGKADEAYVVDKQTGKVVGTAHIDPSSGTWVEGTDSDGPSAVGGGTGAGTDGGRHRRRDHRDDHRRRRRLAAGAAVRRGHGRVRGPSGRGGQDDRHRRGRGGRLRRPLHRRPGGRAHRHRRRPGGRAGDGRGPEHRRGRRGRPRRPGDRRVGRGPGARARRDRGGRRHRGPAPATAAAPTARGPGRGSGGYDDGGAGTQTTGTTSSGEMTVQVGGQTQQLPAERDYTGDGHADAAVETKDGQVIVFSDTENNETGAAGPDGKADEAWIVDKETGKVVGAAHVDPRTGEWVDGVDTDGPSSVPAGSGGASS